jgi:hypothetical protein
VTPLFKADITIRVFEIRNIGATMIGYLIPNSLSRVVI